ncbi:MAG: DUF2191 domain-containing protein [Candidatus Omnitrophica bacterium]|nr:DUF2191 domain-containing protein [Candidatus Omnitrophota bacterium]
MRTTVNLRDEALRLGKKVSGERGLPLGEVLSEAVLVAFGERALATQQQEYDLPTAGEGGLAPGVDLDNTSALFDLMEGR